MAELSAKLGKPKGGDAEPEPRPSSSDIAVAAVAAHRLVELDLVTGCFPCAVAVEPATRHTHPSTSAATTQTGDSTTEQRVPGRSAAYEASCFTRACAGGVGIQCVSHVRG